MTSFLLALIAFYRRWISPALHAVSTSQCKFIPTCSEYAAGAIATHGPLRGCGLAAWRLVALPSIYAAADSILFLPRPTGAAGPLQQRLRLARLPCPANRYHRRRAAQKAALSDR